MGEAIFSFEKIVSHLLFVFLLSCNIQKYYEQLFTTEQKCAIISSL